MSGIEAAGLVLGAIPLVVAGLKSYVEGVATVKRYFRYKNELKSLLRGLTTEYDIFRNSCEELLEGLAQPHEMTILLEKPGEGLWKDPVIQQKLKGRLQEAYLGYIETMNAMESAVMDFQMRLKLKDGKVQFTDASTFKQEYKRLKFSLSKSTYEDLMDEIRQNNQTLSQLIGQSMRLENSRGRRHRHVPDFKNVRDCAKSVYATLRSSWQCACRNSHAARLGLESRIEGVEPNPEKGQQRMEQLRFRIVFLYSKGGTPTSISAPWSWKEADIQLIAEKPKQSTAAELGLVTVSKRKGVRFQDEFEARVLTVPNKQPDFEPINNLCEVVQKLQIVRHEECLGVLIDEFTKQRHGIFPPKELLIDKDSWSTVSPQNLINPQATFQRQLNRGQRLRLAVVLASSVLQLHETPWMERAWRKDDIMFIQTADGHLHGQPFISRNFSADETGKIGDKSNINHTIRNPMIFYLGVLLIELCLGKPLEALKRTDERAANGSDDPLLDWVAANRLIEDTYLEGGNRYGDAVRRCIRCDFDQREASLENDEFQRAVYQGVVALLEDDLRQFHGL